MASSQPVGSSMQTLLGGFCRFAAPMKHAFVSQHLLVAGIVIACVFLELGRTVFWEPLRFLRGPIVAGEYWRLFTCHFVHLGWWHVGMNMAPLVIYRLLFPQLFVGLRGVVTLLILGFGVSGGLLFFSHDVRWYVGFSGVLIAYFIMGVIEAKQYSLWLRIPLILTLLLKIVMEQLGGVASLKATKFLHDVVVTDAHLYGLLLAVAMTGYVSLRARGEAGHHRRTP